MADPSTREASPALHHVLRRQILRCMEEGDAPRSPSQIARQTRRPLSNVSYHVRVLRNCQAIARARRVAAGKATEHFYRSLVPGNPLVEELLRATEAEDEEELPRRRSARPE